jgi:hypothetical protein
VRNDLAVLAKSMSKEQAPSVLLATMRMMSLDLRKATRYDLEMMESAIYIYRIYWPHQIKYKTLSWELVAVLMIAEIISNGMLSLPSSLAVVGMVPGLVIIVFLGVFATYTSWLLVKFKLRHPEVHTMGDAGMILFGPIGRDILSFGYVRGRLS